MTEPDYTGVRWSTVVRCIRKGYYQHVNAPSVPLVGDSKRYYARGNWLADAWRNNVIADKASEGIETFPEYTVPWTHGIGHADLYVPDEELVVESYVNPKSEVVSEKALQVAGYARFLGVPNAMLMILNPTIATETGIEQTAYPVNVTRLAEQVDEYVSVLDDAITTDTPPDRCASTPNHPMCRWCEYQAHCWQGWERPLPDLLVGEAAEIAKAALRAEEAWREQRGSTDAIDIERNLIRDQLADHLEPGDVAEGRGVRIRRTRITRTPDINLSAWLKTGHTLNDIDSELRGFVTTSTPYDRWTITRIEDQ